jgi:hypothetical protein
LGRSADNIWLSNSYSTETPRTRKLWWRIRDALRRPVKNSLDQFHYDTAPANGWPIAANGDFED